MSTIFYTLEFLKVQIRITRSKFALLSDVLSGDQIKFITEKPYSTFDIVEGISKAILNNAARFVNYFKEPSAAMYLQTAAVVFFSTTKFLSSLRVLSLICHLNVLLLRRMSP